MHMYIVIGAESDVFSNPGLYTDFCVSSVSHRDSVRNGLIIINRGRIIKIILY